MHKNQIDNSLKEYYICPPQKQIKPVQAVLLKILNKIEKLGGYLF